MTEGPAASRFRQTCASLTDASLLLAPWLAVPAAMVRAELDHGWRRESAWAAFFAVAIASGGGVTGALVAQSVLLATAAQTVGMRVTGVRLEGGAPFRRFFAPALALAIELGALFAIHETLDAVGASDGRGAVAEALQGLERDTRVFWTPVLIVVPIVAIVVATGRGLVDWIAGGRPRLAAAPSSMAPLRGWGWIDALLLAAVTLPGVIGTGVSAAVGGPASTIAEGVCAALAVGAFVGVEWRSWRVTGTAIGGGRA